MSDSSKGIERLIRRHLIGIKPYVAIEPLEVLGERLGLPVERLVKLDGNENPYGCSPRVSRAFASYPSFHIYPDPLHQDLRRALEKYTGVSEDQILVGNGSDELIDLVLRLFLEPGEKAISCVPTFGMYPFCTEVCGGRLVEVPRDSAYAVDTSAVKEAIDKDTKVVFVASPNNPTGTVTPQADVLELVKTGVVVVVDEAYYEFSGATVAPLVAEHENLVVFRSLSKWAGLAGLRIGYGVFPRRMIEYLYKIKQPYNVNVAAQVAALESLADLEYLRGTVRSIVSERERLFAKLEGLEFLKPFPSQANFILCAVLGGDARSIKEELEKLGIFVRYYDTPLLRNMIRISVGRPEHTDALVEALRKVGGG